MELIVINENKLKIAMTAQDMELYEINENDFHISSINMRAKLEKILHNSPTAEKFKEISTLDKLFMQMYSDKNGGCELFITRIETPLQEDKEPMSYDNNERLLPPRKEEKAQIFKKKTLCYKINDLDSLLRACQELKSRNFCGQSRIFTDQTKQYFLFLSNETVTNAEKEIKSPPLSFLSEFGELENSERESLRLLEYGTQLFEHNAVEAICEAFE